MARSPRGPLTGCVRSRARLRGALLLALLVLSARATPADVRVAPIFASGMVLQRGAPVRLWGFAAPGEALAVRASWGVSAETAADKRGTWRVELAPPAGGAGPATLTIRGRNELVLDDLLFGEVWLCGGQSNMEWTLGPGVGEGVEGWQAAAAAADLPHLRFFTVAHQTRPAPAAEVVGTWRRATPESVRTLSAVAFYFGRELEHELAAPVGLVVSCWGGTPVEAWTSRAALRDFPEFAADLELQARLAADPDAGRRAFEADWSAWWDWLGNLDPCPSSLSGEGWSDVEVPGFLETRLGEHDGTAWFGRELELPAAWAARVLALELGAIDDMDTVFLNGKRVAASEAYGAYATPRRYRLPAGSAVAGRNLLLVRVLDTGGPGGFSSAPAELGIATADGAERVALAGTWRLRRGLALGDPDLGPIPVPPDLHPGRPGVLHDGMIAPLTALGIRGAIFYQGEANVGRAEQYRRLFPALIGSWRADFGHDFPFLFVQIAPFGYANDQGEAFHLREAQALARALPGTGMAVTMDIGDARDIHPKNKLDVGRRLARLALARTYGRDVACEGPEPAVLAAEGRVLRVRFEHARGLTAHGEEPRGFELAGADGVFHAARARIDGQSVLLESPEVAAPVAVRYGFRADGLTNLWNGDGLPARSFRATLDGK